ncbi:MAG: 50S ribosome-binding GTPase [Desulfurococcales archaeon]|nr:50S ribosome-binding GTPase [Desulfurococcales archaeon]
MELASWRLLARTMKNADVVLEVVDIRDPIHTRSRRVEQMAEAMDKDLIIVLNKSDLVPRNVAEKWARIIEGQGYDVLYISARHRLGTRILRGFIKHVVRIKPFSVVVVGYPKTGKSSIINALRGRKGAQTSPIPGSPGYTKAIQLLKIEPGFYMIDTPGVIPVEGGWPEAIIRGRSPEELVDPVPPAVALLERALKYNPKAVEKAYGIRERDPMLILEELARKRGWYYKLSKEPLIEEAARTIIRDYHRAKLLFYVPPEEYLGGRH